MTWYLSLLPTLRFLRFARRVFLLAVGKASNQIHGAYSVTVSSNNYLAANSVSGEVALSDPRDAQFGRAWWASQEDIPIEVWMAIQASNSEAPAWQSIFTRRSSTGLSARPELPKLFWP